MTVCIHVRSILSSLFHGSKSLPSHLSIGSGSSETPRTTGLPREKSVLYLQLISGICLCFRIYSFLNPLTKVQWLKNVHAVHCDYCIICKKRGTSTDTFLKSRNFSKDNENLLVPCWKYSHQKTTRKRGFTNFRIIVKPNHKCMKLHVLKSEHLQCTYIR